MAHIDMSSHVEQGYGNLPSESRTHLVVGHGAEPGYRPPMNDQGYRSDSTIPQQYYSSKTIPPNPYLQSLPPPKTPLANPGILGLFSFATTTLILSLFNAQARGIQHPNVVVGMAIFCGGLAQLLAGMWEFPSGNTFGATAFTSYGAFWMSYASILLPGTGIIAAYDGSPTLKDALGIYLVAWTVVTFLFFIVTLRKSGAMVALFGCLLITFFLLAVGEFSRSTLIPKIAGILGVITAVIAYYIGLAELLAAEKKPIKLPLFPF